MREGVEKKKKFKARNERELFNEWREGKNKLRDKKKGTRRKGQGERDKEN